MWWTKSKKEIGTYIPSLISRIENRNPNDRLLTYARLYQNDPISSLGIGGYARNDNVKKLTHRVTLNVIHSMCDTITTKITKNKPKPDFLTVGGDWSMRRRAKKLTRFIEGQFRDSGIYPKARRVFLDATIFGTGALKIYRHNNEICCERVLRSELFIDDREAIYGDPVQLHQRKYVHAERLKNMFPGNDKAIDDVAGQGATPFGTPWEQDTSGMVATVEAWHLPSSDDASDGRHVVCIDDKCLLDEPWENDYFPFVFMHWNEPILGFWGQGLAEQLMGIQIEINKLLRTIQAAIHLTAVPKFMVSEPKGGSGIIKSHYDNMIGTIIQHKGPPPKFVDMSAISPDLYREVDSLYSKAYEITGISQLSAQSKKPQGMYNALAMQEYHDIETERFNGIGQRWEEFFINAARQMINIVKEIADDTGNFSVKAPIKGRKFLKTIDWNDVDLEESKYVMQVFPVSWIPNTRAGAIQRVTELQSLGLLDNEQTMRLLDIPDIESETTLMNAGVEYIDETIEKMIETKEYIQPDPHQDLVTGARRVQMMYLMLKQDDASDEILDLLAQWIDDARALTAKAVAAQQPQMQQPVV